MKKNTFLFVMGIGSILIFKGVATAEAEEKNFAWKTETALTQSITIENEKQVTNLISVPVNQKVTLDTIADHASNDEMSVMEVNTVAGTNFTPVKDGIKVEGDTITVKKEGLSFVKVVVNGQNHILAVEGLASTELSDYGWKVSQSIDEIQMPDQLNDSIVYELYDRYYKADTNVKSDVTYEKDSVIQFDGQNNKFLLPNAFALENAKKKFQNYFSENAFVMESIKEISEYEGLLLTWSHKFSKKDLLAYDFMNEEQYSEDQKSVYEYITIYDKNQKVIHTAKLKVSLKQNKNKISLIAKMKKNGQYTAEVKNGFGKSKTYKFKTVYKKINKQIYVKKGTYLYSATYQGKKLRKLKKRFNFYGQKKGSNGWIRVRYADGKYGYIKTKNITYKRLLPGHLVNKSDTKYSYNDMVKDLKQFKNYYGGIFDIQKYGKSEDNRDLYYIRMGNPNAKKKVIVQSSMHAREWMNTQIIMAIMEDYARGYYSKKYGGKSYKQLFDHVCFYVIPMYNPDGVTISQYGPSKIRNKTLRAKVKKIGNYTRWKANARGVDLNKNFEPGFKKGGHPSSEGYAGTKPYSESETQAMLQLIEKINTKIIINYHEAGSIIYYSRSSKLVSTVHAVTGYTLTYSDAKDAGGTFGDWQYYHGWSHCTPETGTGVAPMAHSQFWGSYKKNKNVMAAVAKAYY